MINKAIDFCVDKCSLKRRTPFWKYTFCSKAYLDDFDFGKAKKHVVIPIILLLFSDYLISNIGTDVFNFISAKINKGRITNVLFYGLLMPATILYGFNRIAKGYLPTLNSIFNTLIYGFIYVYVIRSNNVFTLLPTENYLKFADICFILTVVTFWQWSLYFKRIVSQSENYQFIIDRKVTDDIFGYKALSKELADFIHHTESEHSFAIGILGGWGDGKTFITNQIIGSLEEHRDDYIVIEFNPWLYDKNLLIENFFREFLKGTSVIHKSLPNDFISYISKITGESNNEKITVASFVIKLIHDDRSVDEIKKSISRKILLSRKKIVVVIDDTDRLDNEEIYSVLKIIRNSADFANTFFIAGIDYQYICDKIGEAKYLEKIFNVLTPLPKVSEAVFKQEISRRFSQSFPNDENLTSSLDELLSHKWFTYFLTNVRQLNRLINSFKISYNKLKDHADLKDLLLLETLKNSATKSYLQILKGEILHYDLDMYIATDSHTEGWKIDLEGKYTKEVKLKWALDKALTFLVKRPVPSSIRAFSNGYDLMYFNFNNENISIVDFYNIIEGDRQSIIEVFNQWILRNGPEKTELLQLLTLYIENNVTSTYEKIIPILLELSNVEFATTVFESSYIPNSTAVNFEFKNTTQYLKNTLDLLYRNKDKNPSRVIDWTSKIVRFVIDIEYEIAEHIAVNQILGTTEDTTENTTEEKVSFLTENSNLIEKNYIQSLSLINRSNYTIERKVRLFSKCIVESKNWDPIVSERCRIILMKEIFEEFNFSELVEFIQDFFVLESLYSHTEINKTISLPEQMTVYNHTIDPNSKLPEALWSSSYRILNQLSLLKDKSNKPILYEIDLFLSYVYYVLTGLWGNVPTYSQKAENTGFGTLRRPVKNIRENEIDKLSEISNQVPEDSLIYIQICSMLAKFYLEEKDYKNVVKYSKSIINSPILSLSADEAVLKPSNESIVGFNLDEYPSIKNEVFRVSCKKENFMHIIRYTEILLIVAEANFYLNKKEEALGYINEIRGRNKKESISIGKDDFIDILLREWRKNLGSEGSYFFALKRNERALEELKIEPYQLLLPIPMQVLMLNPNISQNDGYY